jgi:hypothetical protein
LISKDVLQFREDQVRGMSLPQEIAKEKVRDKHLK